MKETPREIRYRLRNKESPREMRLHRRNQRKEAEICRVEAVSDTGDYEEVDEEDSKEMNKEEWEYFNRITWFPYSREQEEFFDHLHDKYGRK